MTDNSDAVLAGGPYHGKRIRTATRQITMVYTPPIPLAATRPAPRPKLWRDPRGWIAWKPGAAIDVGAELGVSQHLYVYTADGHDGSRVYMWQGAYAGTPPADNDDVLHAVYAAMKAADPADWDGGHVEMGPDWWQAVRRAAFTSVGGGDLYAATHDSLFGLPVRVTHGSPRIVADR
jgi:hypothetical protein